MSWNDDICQTGILNFTKRSNKVKCPEELWDNFYPEYATCSDDQERDDMIALTLYILDELGNKVRLGKSKRKYYVN